MEKWTFHHTNIVDDKVKEMQVHFQRFSCFQDKTSEILNVWDTLSDV